MTGCIGKVKVVKSGDNCVDEFHRSVEYESASEFGGGPCMFTIGLSLFFGVLIEESVDGSVEAGHI